MVRADHVSDNKWLATYTTDNIQGDAQAADAAERCDAINGVAVPNTNENVQFTDFINEACDQVSIRQNASSYLQEMETDEMRVTDLKQYFSRPIKLASFPYTATSAFKLYSLDITNANVQTKLYNFTRIKGAFGWRATFCFRLQAISNPFQAGRIRMAFSPFQVIASTTEFDRTVGPCPVSQLPGVELDIAESTSAVLKVPFITAMNYWPVAANNAVLEKLGQLGVFAYTPVALAAGAPNPSFAIWMWLEDFETIAAAPYEIEAQMGKMTKSTASKEADAIPGNLSNVLSAGSNLMLWAGKIPMLSTIAGPASWALRLGANVASSFGWSKPIDATPPNKVYNSVNIHQNNADGPDVSFNLGMMCDNAVSVLPGFAGSDMDEMSLSYITGVYSAIASVTLSTTMAADDNVISVNCSPFSLHYTTDRTCVSKSLPPAQLAGTSFWPSSVMGVSNVFRSYRGGLKFRVKISKTKFHTGRLIVGFMPVNPDINQFGVSAPFAPSIMQYKSVIWDLRESNSVEFECPYVSFFPYLPVDLAFGSFFVMVLEPLNGPTTVASTVPIIVEVAGMDDFELAFPSRPAFPISPLNTTYVAQSGLSELSHSSNAVGERITSIKQLIMRACIIDNVFVSGAFSYVFNYIPNTWFGAPATSLTVPRLGYLNYFNAFYGLSRGGYCMDIVPFGDICATVGYPNADSIDSVSLVPETRSALHVKVPYYNRRTRDIVSSARALLGPPASIVAFFSKAVASTAKASVFLRAADDFQLGYYLGAPPFANDFAAAPNLGVTYAALLATDH